MLLGSIEGDLLDLFVHHNSNSMLSDIKNATSFAVVNFVRHSFMDGTIDLKEKNKQNHKIPYKTTLEKILKWESMRKIPLHMSIVQEEND